VTEITDNKNVTSLKPGKLTVAKTQSTKSLSAGIALSMQLAFP